MQRYPFSEPMFSSLPFGHCRVEVVPDNNAEANPLIPKDVLDALGSDEVLMSLMGHMMYVRASLWERIKDRISCGHQQKRKET